MHFLTFLIGNTLMIFTVLLSTEFLLLWDAHKKNRNFTISINTRESMCKSPWDILYT